MNAIIGNLPQILSDVKADYCTASHPFVVTDEDIRGIVMALV
jgi:hypothetical protein